MSFGSVGTVRRMSWTKIRRRGTSNIRGNHKRPVSCDRPEPRPDGGFPQITKRGNPTGKSRHGEYLIIARRGDEFFTVGAHGTPSELDNSAPHGDRHGLSAISRAELFDDVFDVNLDSLFGDEKAFGNVLVTIAAGDVLQNFHLTVRQRFIAQMLCQTGGNVGGNPLF